MQTKGVVELDVVKQAIIHCLYEGFTYSKFQILRGFFDSAKDEVTLIKRDN